MRCAMMLFPIAAALALTACQPQSAPARSSDVPPVSGDGCGAQRLASWMGKSDTPTARNAIARDSGASSIRWLTPGMAVTMDYRPDRLNVHIDDRGRYTGFDCA